jgi:hypothetical protein
MNDVINLEIEFETVQETTEKRKISGRKPPPMAARLVFQFERIELINVEHSIVVVLIEFQIVFNLTNQIHGVTARRGTFPMTVSRTSYGGHCETW